MKDNKICNEVSCKDNSAQMYKNNPRTSAQVKDILTRFNKITGQINGIKKMVEENRYCPELLIQISAAKKALESVALKIFENHLETCVAEKIKNNDDNIIAETVEIFKKLV